MPSYGGLRRRVPGDLRPVLALDRPFLHAGRLVFHHPADGRKMEFEAPLPHDLQSCSIRSCRKNMSEARS